MSSISAEISQKKFVQNLFLFDVAKFTANADIMWLSAISFWHFMRKKLVEVGVTLFVNKIAVICLKIIFF